MNKTWPSFAPAAVGHSYVLIQSARLREGLLALVPARAQVPLLAPTVALSSVSLLLSRHSHAVDIVMRQLISWVEPLRLLELA